MRKPMLFVVGLCMLQFAGCASASRQSQIYPMSYDKTYQMAIDALSGLEDWRVIETDQLGGEIRLEKGGYFLPRRNAKVWVKRVDPFKTRVELYDDPASMRQGEFLDVIDQYVQSRRFTYPS